MKKPNPEYIKRIKELVNSSPYFTLLSMEIRDIGIGFSVVEINLDQKHLQPFGLVHGGTFASIIDAAAFWAFFYDLEDQNDGATSVDLKLNYLLPATSGKLIAKGRQIKHGKTLGYAEATVTNENNRILAHGTSTLMRIPGKGLTADPPLPVKFLEKEIK